MVDNIRRCFPSWACLVTVFKKGFCVLKANDGMSHVTCVCFSWPFLCFLFLKTILLCKTDFTKHVGYFHIIIFLFVFDCRFVKKLTGHIFHLSLLLDHLITHLGWCVERQAVALSGERRVRLTFMCLGSQSPQSFASRSPCGFTIFSASSLAIFTSVFC